MIELLQLVGWIADAGHAVADLRKQRKEEKKREEAAGTAKKPRRAK